MFSDVLGTSGFFYVGQEYDAETGLQHSRARYYDPVSSEFISQDPLGFAGGDTNLYRRDRNQSVSARPRDRYWSEWAWEMGTSYDTFSMSVHSGLAAAGAVPGFGVIPDLIDLVYTAVEMPFGKSTGTDLGLATVGVAATVVPIGGDQAAAAAKIAARAGRVVRQAATAVGTVAMVAARPIARGVAHAAGALPASVKRFVDEAIGVGKNAVAPVNGMNEFVGPTIGRSGFRTAEELSHAIFSRYQRYADDAYASVMKGIDKGRIKLDPSMAAETQIGSLVDRATRSRLRRWATKEFGSEGPDSIVRVNRWLRDSAGSGYRIPDLAAPGHIFDLTIGLKSGLTPQIADFFQFSGGSRVTIVRPSQLQAVDGGYGSYSILR